MRRRLRGRTVLLSGVAVARRGSVESLRRIPRPAVGLADPALASRARWLSGSAWYRRTVRAVGVAAWVVIAIGCGASGGGEQAAAPAEAPGSTAVTSPPVAESAPPVEARAPERAASVEVAAQAAAAEIAAEPGAEVEGEEEDVPPEPGVDEDGLPVVDPALRSAERLGPGPWVDEIALAAGAGVVDFSADEIADVVAQIEHRRRTYALMTTPSRAPRPPMAERSEDVVALWLARIESRTVDGATDGETEHRRIDAIRLQDGVVFRESTDMGDCSVPTELRARDVDGDREVEITVLAQALTPLEEGERECGTLAFIVGDDLGVQARLTREYVFGLTGASGDTTDRRQTTWQLRDVDGDGHADLHVTETWAFTDDFAGDWDGEGTFPGQHSRGRDRRELDCPWVEADDVWRCPADQPAPGLALFAADRGARGGGSGARPW